MSINIRYNTSPTATAAEFGVRPLRRADRIRLMRSKADELAEWLRSEAREAITVERIEEDDDYSNPFSFSDLSPSNELLVRQFMVTSPPLVMEANATIRMMDDDSISTVARLAPLMITDPDVAIAVAHEVLSVAHDVVPEMLQFMEYVQVVDPGGPFEPEARGIHHADKGGRVDRSAVWGHIIRLPLDAHISHAVSNCLDAAAVAHEAAHVMAGVSHLRMFGHDRRWVRSYCDLLHELVRRGTVDVICDIVAGRQCRSSVPPRALPPISIHARDYLGGPDAGRGLAPFDILRMLVTSFPERMPGQPILNPYIEAMRFG